MAPWAAAQQPRESDSMKDEDISLGQLQPTPEMWLYLQETKRQDDPKLAARRKAEFKAAQRMRRLEAQRWFGYSASRPMASPQPYTGTYSPYWGSNTNDPFRWAGIGGSTYYIVPSGRPTVAQRLW